MCRHASANRHRHELRDLPPPQAEAGGKRAPRLVSVGPNCTNANVNDKGEHRDADAELGDSSRGEPAPGDGCPPTRGGVDFGRGSGFYVYRPAPPMPSTTHGNYVTDELRRWSPVNFRSTWRGRQHRPVNGRARRVRPFAIRAVLPRVRIATIVAPSQVPCGE